MAEIKYLQVFPDYIFLSFPFFNNHITLAKYGSIAIKTCLKRIETNLAEAKFSIPRRYSYKDLFKKDWNKTISVIQQSGYILSLEINKDQVLRYNKA